MGRPAEPSGIVGRVHFSRVHFSRLASRLRRSAQSNCEKCLEMEETQFLLFIGTFEKCLEMGETQFLLFIGSFEKCLEMGETHFLLFIGTFGRNGKIITFVTDRPTDRQLLFLYIIITIIIIT